MSVTTCPKGSRWRLTSTVDKIAAGTEVEVHEPTVDHLDWYAIMVILPDGAHRLMPWALDTYAERIDV